MFDRVWVWFADNGNIRKWQREPFEEGAAFISTITPAEVGGLITELCDAAYRNAGPAGHEARIEYRAATALEAQAAELTARPDWPSVNATYEKWKARAKRTEAQRDEALKALVERDAALEPFAWIGQWLFSRDLPDETPVVMVEGAGRPFALTRGMFKTAHTAARRALTGGKSDG